MIRFASAVIAVVVAFFATASRGATLEAIEYYNNALDHYFVTSFADEIAKLDAGDFVGWRRTGQHFTVIDPATPQAGASPVCRFYGLPSAGLDSHFYSASLSECQSVLQRFPGVWEEETPDAFGLYLPNFVTGACPTQTIPVYRAWNGRVDSNHRFTTDLAMFQAMLARGSVAEGYGPAPYPVAMCSPSTSSPPPPATAVPVCTVTASPSTAYAGSSVTLAASCTNGPTSFTWTDCASTSSTCTATSPAVGAVTYTVFASNPSGQGAPAGITIVWQGAPAAPRCTIARSSQTDPPTVGGFLLLEAECDGDPQSFSWIGCDSTTSVCVAHETAAGVHPYTVVARNFGGSGEAALAIVWSAGPPPAAGFCGSFPSYLVSDVGTTTGRVHSTFMPSPGFAWNGAWSIRFTVPPTMGAGQVGRMAGGEFIGPPTFRDATISNLPCDFRAVDPTGVNGPYSRTSGISVSNAFVVDPSQPGLPVLVPGGTYYYNVRNYQPIDGTITCSSSLGRCDAYVDSILPQ
jgi:hypothetical protein